MTALWYWLVLAAILGLIEVAAPAMVCIWLVGAALGTAAVSWIAPGLAWEQHALIFSPLAIASVGLGRIAFAPARSPSGHGHLNRRAESYIGRMFTLDGAIVDGRGRLNVDDTVWLVAGPDLPAGAHVRIIVPTTPFCGSSPSYCSCAPHNLIEIGRLLCYLFHCAARRMTR